MEEIHLKAFAEIVSGKLINITAPEQTITKITTDSRRIQNGGLFFALKGPRYDGHQFVSDAINQGAIGAVVSRYWFNQNLTNELPLIVVEDPLTTLQAITAWWRKQLKGKVIAVTGSNGKTVVKDTLVRLLNSSRYQCAGSKDSFNSQVGVPLSIERIRRNIDFAVLEAGIYKKGDMSRLETIIRPDYGILTNIGYAHINSFDNSREIISKEKATLFKNITKNGWILIPSDELAKNAIKSLKLQCPIYEFGSKYSNDLPVISECKINKQGAAISIRFPQGNTIDTIIVTPSREIITDIEIAVCAAYLLGIDINDVQEALNNYVPGISRMEMWKSPTGITLINDTCSSDPLSVQSSLRTLYNMKNGGKTFFVYGGMRELGNTEKEGHSQVGLIAAETQVDTLVLVGKEGADITEKAFREKSSQGQVIRSQSSHDVKKYLLPKLKSGDIVLVKGPRNTGIDLIARDFVEAMAPTRYYIDLQAINENIKQFECLVGSNVKILAMVKALAYGSDASRLSIELQRMGIDFFGVASADEGRALRKAGIDREILVMMCTKDEVEKAVAEDLTPVVYSFDIVRPLAKAARKYQKKINVHMEVDTGLGRLGVRPEEASKLARSIKESNLCLTGLLTHFACAENPSDDDFTNKQIQRFISVKNKLYNLGFKKLLCHASATSGAARFPNARFDMVRLGLGMYGIYPSCPVEEKIKLSLAVSLVSRVIEKRFLHKGDRIGYGGTFIVEKDVHPVGVVPIGYHDGIPLNLSNKGIVKVNGKEARILGRISMDSMIIDLSEIPEASEGMDVIIYGEYGGFVLRPEIVAEKSGTITYELLARLGPRVQRIYIGQQDNPDN